MNEIYRIMKTIPRWALFQTILVVIGLIPIPLARLIGRWVGRCGYRLRSRERQLACNHLARLDPHMGEPTRKRLIRRNYQQMGETILEAAALAGKSRDHLGSPPRPGGVEVTGLQRFREQVARLRSNGRGVIIISGHIGSWEIAGALIGREFGNDGLFVARRYNDSMQQRSVDAIRRQLGSRLVFQDESLIRSVRLLTGGGVLTMLTDLDIKRMDGVHLPFFGELAHTSTAPARLALKSGAVLLPTFFIRNRHGYQVELDDPIDCQEIAPSTDQEQILTLTGRMNQAIERAIRRHPTQWPWMHDRWHSTPEVVERRKKHRS